MTDGCHTLGLSASRPSSSSSAGPSSHGGSARAKTPLRARKILKAMDDGFEKTKRAAAEERGEEVKATTEDAQPAKRPRLSSRPRQAYLAKLADRQRDGDEETADDDAAAAAPDDQACSSSSTSIVTAAPRPAPPVTLFSSSSKRQLTALTSKSALKDTRNPITHSSVGRGTMHYQSSSTGHQVQNRVSAAGPSPEGWWATRTRKLGHQLRVEGKETDLFRGCKVYINGYTGEDSGNKELMRTLSLNGAEVHFLPRGDTTHIVSEMQLSAKKREEMLRLKAGRVKRFVKVEWVTDSIAIGKRRPEHLYSHGVETQRGIADMLGEPQAKPTSSTSSIPTPFVASAGSKVSATVASKPSLNPASSDWRAMARKEAKAMAKAPTKGCSG